LKSARNIFIEESNNFMRESMILNSQQIGVSGSLMIPPTTFRSKGGLGISGTGSAFDVLGTQNLDDYDELTASQIDNMY
jgi:hypothetical protein